MSTSSGDSHDLESPGPFENEATTLIKKFMSSAVGKIYKLYAEKLRELEAPWHIDYFD